MNWRLLYFSRMRNILVFYFLVYNFVDGYWSNSEGMGEGTGFGSAVEELFKPGSNMFKEKTEIDEETDSSASKPDSVVGSLIGGSGRNSAILCPSGK